LIYWLLNKDTDPNAWAKGLGIIALFQVVPLSPGSLCRGMYVLYLVIKERNFKDYNIAVFLGFFKYIGYLAFPIQMAYRYPVMARFMAGHWATEAVHIVPVFGEKGALLEHKIFGLFYNLPLTLRRRMGRRAELRSSLAPRRWHVLPTALMGAGLLSVWQYFTYCATSDSYPWLGDMKIMALVISLLCGMAVTLAAGGLTFGRRIVLASIGGVALGITHGLTYLALAHLLRPAPEQLKTVETFIWGIFAFTIFSTIGAIITELKLPEPKTR
ncbi:MAG: hypothetical protein K9M57_10875, partial [Phycisphaerae bacterium]|nr:hypothetical protein [Phycisphaerae bacterium]